MDMELRVRNHDIGLFSPTFQERINGTLPVAESFTGARAAADACAAPALEERASATPHYPDNEEVRATLSRMEEEGRRQGAEIVEIHSGLNELRVARLLGLLE
ncbi:MAG: pseudouridine synthase [Desulfovibrio sp.]|nr:pseudouridine synthase [Desulfovibrio sp.]